MTKIQAMKEMEANGMGFTANVLMNGCSKPTARMVAILNLIKKGHNVRPAQFETCAIVVDGVQLTFGRLDVEYNKLLEQIQLEQRGWTA